MAELFDPRLPHGFWKRVVCDVITGCWNWIGAKTPYGYGMMRRGNTTIGTHRLAFSVLTGRELTPGHHVDHRCRNKSCCNPDHLEEVTPLENARRAKHFRRTMAHDTQRSNDPKPLRRAQKRAAKLRRQQTAVRLRSAQTLAAQIRSAKRALSTERPLTLTFNVSRSTVWRLERFVSRHGLSQDAALELLLILTTKEEK